MRRVGAKKANEDTRAIIENVKRKYDFLSDSYLKKITDNNLNIEDVIQLIAVLQREVFKIPNNIVSIKNVSTLETVPWTIGNVYLYQDEGRFVVLHYKNASTMLYKDSSGSPIPYNIAKLLPSFVTVWSNTIYDGSYNHLMPISNVKIIVGAPVNSFRTYAGFTKSEQVDAFRDQLLVALKALQLTGFIDKELSEIENNVAFKKKLKEFVGESLKYSNTANLAKEYDRILNEETLAFEKEGKKMDNIRIESARRALKHETEKYSNYTIKKAEDEKKQQNEIRHQIEKDFPNESKHFTNIFEYLGKYEVDDNFMVALQLICEKLEIAYNDLKTFFDVHKDSIRKPNSDTPSEPIAKTNDTILAQYAKDKPVVKYNTNGIRTLDELLEEITLLNGLSYAEMYALKVSYETTMDIFNKSWKGKPTKAVYDWATSKRGKLSPKDICEAVAVCIRAHQIVSKGVITLRDIQILSTLIFLTTTNSNFVEISTGEGKTIIISALAVVKVLEGKHVDIITSNEVLANEGLNEMRDFYYLFNIHANTNNYDPTYKEGPRSCYEYDIVYGNIGNFQFDYLRDSFEDDHTRGGRRFDFLILDEVDSLTIDNGTYIAKLAQPFPGVECLRYIYIQIWVMLQKAEQQYKENVYDEIGKIANLMSQHTDDQIQEKCDQYFLNSIKAMPQELKGKIVAMKPLDIPVIPNHLKSYCKQMLDKWIDNAIYAKYHCHENEDYIVQQLKNEDQSLKEAAIVPVDYANTGVTLTNTIWSNGLHQFVQLKHNVKVNSESLTASFISNLGYISLYKNQMYGMTGTLGSKAEQSFLSSIYDLKYMRIPTFKPKNFSELDGMVVRDAAWVSCVIMDAYLKVKEERSVLIICETISDVQMLKEQLDALIQLEDASWIKARYYYDESYAKLVLRDKVGPCEIIVATNIAGRGTNFKSTKDLEASGGLHVCVTFLPCNERVEQQAFGRTSRQGNIGTAHLIIRESNVVSLNYTITEASTLQDIKDHRDRLELQKLDAMKNTKIKEILFKDKLFQEFAKTYRDFLRKQQIIKGGIYLTLDLKERWAFWLRNQTYNGSEDVSVEYGKFLTLAKPILDGNISFNPYYAVKQADYFIKNDNIKGAQAALDVALKLSNWDPYMYPAYLKLFETCIINGGAVMDRFLRALKKLIFIPSSDNDRKYKKAAADALLKAKAGITAEVEYIKTHITENSDFHLILINDAKVSPEAKQATGASAKTDDDEEFVRNNILLKHIYSRYYALLTFQNHVISLLEQLDAIRGGVAFNGKIENYLKELKPSNDSERTLKKNIHEAELVELHDVSVSTIYGIREVHDVNPVVIHGAQIQILAGLAILVGCFFFPPALIIGGPAAGALIGEGLTDIVIDLIRQGDEEFDLQNYIKSKCVSYLISVITLGFTLVAQSIKLLKLAMKTCQGLARFLQKSTRLSGVFLKLAAVCEKYAAKIAFSMQKILKSRSLLSGVTLLRSQAIKIGLKHVGVATGINLAGALVGEFVIAKGIEEILKASRGKILENVQSLVNEKFKNNLTRVKPEQLEATLQGLSEGTIGHLSWEVFKDTVAGLMQMSHSWKVKIAGFTLYSVVNGAEIITYARQYCDETINALKMDQSVNNSEQTIKGLKTLIATSITDDIYRRIMALANSATQTLVVNPLMGNLIRKTMKKVRNKGQDDQLEQMSYKNISDAYKQLGLPEGASESKIKSAYRKLARDYHPDSRKSPNAETFMALARAKDVLIKLHDDVRTINKANQASIKNVAPADLPMAHKGNIETLSRKTGEYIVVKNEATGKMTHFGSDYGRKPLEVHYSPPKKGKPGHYFIKGREKELVPTEKNNCLYDSLALVWNERSGMDVTATGLRIKATSLSFANVKYNTINKFSEVFNNKFTKHIYDSIQGHILIGGFTSKPLVGDTYPSDQIKIKTSAETKQAIIDLQSTLIPLYDDAKAAGVLAGDKVNDIRRITMNPSVKGRESIPVMMFIPANEKSRKNECMMGALHVKFKGHSEELKWVSVSGTTAFKASLVGTKADGDYVIDNKLYKSKEFEYTDRNGYTFIADGTKDVTEVYDVYARKRKPLTDPQTIMGKHEKIPTSCCAAMKLLSKLGEYMENHKDLTIDGDIHMVEGYFDRSKATVGGDIVIESSCPRCAHILPQLTGKYAPPSASSAASSSSAPPAPPSSPASSSSAPPPPPSPAASSSSAPPPPSASSSSAPPPPPSPSSSSQP